VDRDKNEKKKKKKIQTCPLLYRLHSDTLQPPKFNLVESRLWGMGGRLPNNPLRTFTMKELNIIFI
jgi:hypothetical protein